jgi:hypothetical protein
MYASSRRPKRASAMGSLVSAVTEKIKPGLNATRSPPHHGDHPKRAAMRLPVAAATAIPTSPIKRRAAGTREGRPPLTAHAAHP